MTGSGTATSEGKLSASPNGAYVALIGYDAAENVAGIKSAINRTVARIAVSDGSVDLTTTGPLGGNDNARAATVDDTGTNIWVSTQGGSGTGATSQGPRYLHLGQMTTGAQLANINTRGCRIFGGQLYQWGDGSGNYGIFQVGTGLPTGGSPTFTGLPGLSGDSTLDCYGFYMADLSPSEPGYDTIWLARDTVGVSKYSKVGGTWTSNNTLSLGANPYHLDGAPNSSGGVDLYVVVGDSDDGTRIMKMTDTTGHNANMTGFFTDFVLDGPFQRFRGVAVVPAAGVSMTPSVTITNPATSALTVPNATASYDLSGTSSNTVGHLSWSNSLTTASGTVMAGATWGVSGIGLDVGANLITITATNDAGESSSAGVTITRNAFGVYTTPYVSATPGAVTNTLGATTFINHGLVGVGYLSASALDPFGESFGSVSGMQITDWTTNSDGSFSGILNILPDRGYNSGSFYADYAARINRCGFRFTPYYGSANIGGATDLEKLQAQTNQLSFGAVSGVKFTYVDPIRGAGSYTTGLDPATNSASVFGKTLPYVKTYVGYQSPSSTSNSTFAGINKLALDCEALALKADGSGYIGDEYGASVYYFNAAKQIVGAIMPPAAIQPHSPSNVLNFSSAITPVNGRRNNQGFEGVSLSPDGARLFVLLQSACRQDSDSSNNQNAQHARLLVFDVTGNPTPASPIAEYALTLPAHRQAGDGGAVNRTSAQSELVALDRNRLLVLSRDGNGLGNSSGNPNVYKCVLLVDTSVGAPTDFASDVGRNAEGGKITTASGALDPAIAALSYAETVNLLNSAQLGKFNVAIDQGGANQVSKLTMGEKWEGMALVPANDPANPDDYFLFVGNDNDFLTSDGRMRGPDGTIVSYNGFSGYGATRVPAPLDSANNENDTRILVYRVTITPGAQAPVEAPTVTIGAPSAETIVVPNGTASYTLSGTVPNSVGVIALTNSLGGGATQAASVSWTFADVPLAVGVNKITVTVSNAAGIAVSKKATIIRQDIPASDALRIAAFSDPHYFATNLLIGNGVAFQTYLAQDRKLIAESAAITKEVVDQIIVENPNYVLVTGDLTKDGELDSHVAFSNELARLEAAGAQVLVVPGNHDIGNTQSLAYNGASTIPVPNISVEQFRAIYAPFGYDLALATDVDSAAYVVELTPNVVMICMDPCQYGATAGSFDASRLAWITNQIATARNQGKLALGMMHHGLMEHFQGQKTLFSEYVLDNYANIAPLFASLGMKAVFTGHFHANDIVGGAFGIRSIYDIETGSTVTWPCPYRLMELDGTGKLAILTEHITEIDYNLGGAPDFQTYAYNYLYSGMLGISSYMLQMPPYSLPAPTANYLAPAVTEALIDHYAGDEPGLAGASPATYSIVTNLLAGDPLSQQLGQAIYSILSDLPPSDNDEELDIDPSPVVTLTVINGATGVVGQAVSLSATVMVGGFSGTVSFLVDGNVVATVDAAPYTANWTPASAGSHVLMVVATDDFGQSVTSMPVTVTMPAAYSNYLAGDFHQHTTFTDGSYSFDYQMAKNNQFGLDWWANSEHGGGFNSDGRRSGTGADPLNRTVYWDQEPGVTILGNNLGVSGGHTNMWRWQSIRDYSFPALTNARAMYPSKVIVQGYEWNVPGVKPAGSGGNGHEHCSMGAIAGEFGVTPNADVVAEFEYRFDMNDADTSAANGMGWVKSTNSNSSDAKMVEAAAWLQANYAGQSWLAPAHPERKKNWNAQTFRMLNDAAPDVAFGFESMPGHQRSANRGEYTAGSAGGGTYGGCGVYAAQVGGLWDSMLGEGREFWLFSSSDSHDVSANDFYPGEYQKTYTYVTNRSDAAAIVEGLHAGNSWVVEGDLIDSLDFKVDTAVMGETLLGVGPVVTVTITVRDPDGNNWGPTGHNTPALDHIDVIVGDVTGLIAPSDPAYTNDVNPTARVIARFAAVGGAVDTASVTNTAWTDLGGGVKRMSLVYNTQGRKMYFRLRGSNQAVGGPETDGVGNPLLDAPGANTAEKAWDDLWFYSNPIFVAPAVAPVADIKANGSDTPIAITTHDTLVLDVSLDAGAYAGLPVDWWLLADTPMGWYYYNTSNGQWIPGWSVSAGAALSDLPVTRVYNDLLTTPGLYRVYFGVDYPMDGVLETDLLFYDSVEINVVPRGLE